MKRAPTQRHGFFLIELLMVLLVSAAFFLIAARVFSSTMKLNYAASQAHKGTVRLDSAVRMLRADAWNARDLAAKDGVVTVTMFDGSTIAWAVGNDGTLTRTAGNRVQRWPLEAPGLKLAVGDREVIVTIPESQQVHAAEVHVVNQRAIAEGMAS